MPLPSSHFRPPPITAAIIAKILLRLTPEQRVAVEARRHRRYSPLPPVEFWDHWLRVMGRWDCQEPGSPDYILFRAVWQHLKDIIEEEQIGTIEAELRARQSVAEPAEASAPAVWPLHLAEIDDRAPLARMRELRENDKTLSYHAAARQQPGGKDKSVRDRLIRKYKRWQAEGFPPFA